MMESTLDERFGGTLAPDAMLPQQFFAALHGRGDLSAERRLVVAVLEDALHCYLKYADAENPKQRQLFLEAEEWITGDNPTWFFSFSNVCDTLGLDPDYMREGLAKWRDRRPAMPQQPTAEHEPSAVELDDDDRTLRRASGA
ncbi:MAG TPA: hypothetical protein VGK30_09275 [Candidatus Binatia bacterium]|jgi:hypothetical protein